MEENEKDSNAQHMSSHNMHQTMMPPAAGANMGFVPINFMTNLAMFMQQHNQNPTGRHSAPTIPTAGIPFAASAAHPPAPPVQATPAVAATAPQSKKEAISVARKMAVANRKSKSGGKSLHFTQDEKLILLDCIEEMLPIGAIAWEEVVAMYNQRVDEERARDKSSLSRQFSSLWKQNIPTGNPHCPPAVKRAKYIRYKIQGHSGMINADEMSDESGEIDKTKGEEIDTIAAEASVTGEDIERDDLLALQDEAAAAIESGSPTTKSRAERELEEKARAEGKATSSSSKKRKNRKPSTASDTEMILKAILSSDEMAAKREERREKRQEEREKRYYKQQDKKDKKQMKMFMDMLLAVNKSSKNKKKIESVMEESDSKSNSDSDSSLSSVSSSDSPPTKRQKLNRLSKKN